jgi:hypothetical protein
LLNGKIIILTDKKPKLEVCPVLNGVRFDPSLLYCFYFDDSVCVCVNREKCGL